MFESNYINYNFAAHSRITFKMNSLIEKFEIRSYETDFKQELRPFAFMNYAQYMAEKHATVLKFGYENLLENQTVWVLSRVNVHFLEYPRWNDIVTLKTWHKGTDRLFGIRDFRMTASDGREIVVATSSWLIIDIKTRRVQRVDRILPENEENTQLGDAVKVPAGKIDPPQNPELCFVKRVSYSDVDVNEHTNNAKYIEWATDCLFTDYDNVIKIKEMTVNFNSECRMGEEISLYKEVFYESASKIVRIVVEGKRADACIFLAEFKF